ncbi:protein kinase [Methanoregula boonei 6A8]|jgi:Flp pilus assembly protein TadD|uniref:Protein kinase n=1 Tax=Methanoregula boonei (strain DSM 21154 / JCM 14090 / 6A8) TaxID=456442 RepID=A7IAX0_METB6|nr:protein kinase family protein [Methanoregula boonei]ABS56881.1 protein kinase [Methanoregula boonei 6A8]
MGWRQKIVDLFFESEDPPRSHPASSRAWTAGYLVKNRYELLEITKSDQYVTYTARDQTAKKTLSIITVPDNLVNDAGAVQDFMDGADEWVSLGHHTNIVFADFVEMVDGRPLLFSEYTGNGVLRQYLKSFPLEKTLDFAIQFCTGMEYAHEKLETFHGSIRPSSVMVQKNPVFRFGHCYKIRDFGIAQSFPQDPRIVHGKYPADTGTFSFTPPELFPQKIKENFSFHGTASTKSDIYAFGVLLYVMATGKMPFYGPDEIFCGCPERPLSSNPKVPESLDRLIGRCMKRRPEDRYADFGEIKNELKRVFRELTGEEYAVIGRKDSWAHNDWNSTREVFVEPDSACFDEVVTAFECSILLEPENIQSLVNKGDFLAELGRFDEAVSAYARALELSPNDARVWNNKGTLLARCGRLKEAVSAYSRGLELSPGDARAWNNKGVLLAELGRLEEAVTAYTRALELAPADVKIWNNKGDALAELGRFDEAVSAFRHVCTVDPEDTDAWYSTGGSPAPLGRFETALAFETPLPNLPRENTSRPREAEKWYCEGESLARRGKFEEAVSAYDHAITLKPDYADAWLNKGTAYGILGKDRDAVRCFGKFVQMAPPESAAQVREVEQLIGQMKP